MALTFPRQLPMTELKECTFKWVEGTAINRADNGRAVSVVDQYDPFIVATVQTRNLYPAERRQWSAWKNSLRGGMKSFLMWDVSRAFPTAYPLGVPQILANTWDGEGTLTSFTAYEMVTGGAPSGFKLTAGDFVGLVEDGKYNVFEVTEDSTAGGGGAMTISVAPFISSYVFTTDATVVFFRPMAEFVIDPETWEDHGDIEFSPVNFQAMQKI